MQLCIDDGIQTTSSHFMERCNILDQQEVLKAGLFQVAITWVNCCNFMFSPVSFPDYATPSWTFAVAKTWTAWLLSPWWKPLRLLYVWPSLCRPDHASFLFLHRAMSLRVFSQSYKPEWVGYYHGLTVAIVLLVQTMCLSFVILLALVKTWISWLLSCALTVAIMLLVLVQTMCLHGFLHLWKPKRVGCQHVG